MTIQLPVGWISRPALRGLAMALLQHAFAATHTIGKRSVSLAVDASSPTGAVRLYELELRPGIDRRMPAEGA